MCIRVVRYEGHFSIFDISFTAFCQKCGKANVLPTLCCQENRYDLERKLAPPSCKINAGFACCMQMNESGGKRLPSQITIGDGWLFVYRKSDDYPRQARGNWLIHTTR